MHLAFTTSQHVPSVTLQQLEGTSPACLKGTQTQPLQWTGRMPRPVQYGRRPAACLVDRKKLTFSLERLQSSLRLMSLGGSITHGVGSSDQNGYRQELLKLLHASGFDVRMVGSRKAGSMSNNDHEGWRGFRIDQIETRAQASAQKLKPNIFAINAGSNDCLQDHELGAARSRMGRLLDGLWRASPGSTVVLSSLLVNRDGKIDARVKAFNAELEALATTLEGEGRKIVFADMHGAEGPAVDDLGEDGTHPNDAGYRIMAGIWLPAIQKASDKGFL